MSERTYEDYINNGCHPVGYNEACQRLIFSQISIDLLLDRIDQLNLQLKDHENSDSSTMKYLNKLRDENIKLKHQLAIQELEKVNGILTDTIIEVTQNEFDLSKLCYLEEISTRFCEKVQVLIKKLEDNKKD